MGGVASIHHQVVDNLVPGEGSAPAAVLLLQARIGHLPLLVIFTDEMVAGHTHVIHEDGVLVVAHEQLLLLDIQARGGHGDHEVSQVPVSWSVVVGYHWAEEPVWAVHVPLRAGLSADEDVLPREEPVVSVPNCAAGVAGEVSAGPGLRVLLPHHLFTP